MVVSMDRSFNHPGTSALVVDRSLEPMVELLAEELGVKLEVDNAFELSGIFQALERGDAHIAAAGLTLTGPRSECFPHSTAYYRLTPQVVYVAGTYRSRRVEDLLGMTLYPNPNAGVFAVEWSEASRKGGSLEVLVSTVVS